MKVEFGSCREGYVVEWSGSEGRKKELDVLFAAREVLVYRKRNWLC
jgi:hypothetical protein